MPELFSLLATSEYTSNSVVSNSVKLSSPTEEQKIVAVTTRVHVSSDSKALEPVVEEIRQPEEVPNKLGISPTIFSMEGTRRFEEKAATYEPGSRWAALEMTPEELKDA